MSSIKNFFLMLSLFMLLVTAFVTCAPERPRYIVTSIPPDETEMLPTTTFLDERPVYAPGTLVDYHAQSGDTLPYLAWRFGCTEREILFHNPEIPQDVSTLPANFPMKMPIYYIPFWGSRFQIIPDAMFVNGPESIGFDIQAFLDSTPGWFKNYHGIVNYKSMNAAEVIRYYATQYSLNPKLLLAFIEYQSAALSQPKWLIHPEKGFLGFDEANQSFEAQLNYAVKRLTDHFYGYLSRKNAQMTHEEGIIENIDPWQNAASAALQLIFAELYDFEAYQLAIGTDGFARTFRGMFGDPWQKEHAFIPGSLRQPELKLPFAESERWVFSSGPYPTVGSGEAWVAVDFAPFTREFSCSLSGKFVLAVADGVIVRSEGHQVVLDLDGDGDERTGWVIVYSQIASSDRVKAGEELKAGDRIGRPSCDGGGASYARVQITRKFNGQWIPAGESDLPMTLSNWVVTEGEQIRQGWLTRDEITISASKNLSADGIIPTGFE